MVDLVGLDWMGVDLMEIGWSHLRSGQESCCSCLSMLIVVNVGLLAHLMDVELVADVGMEYSTLLTLALCQCAVVY